MAASVIFSAKARAPSSVEERYESVASQASLLPHHQKPPVDLNRAMMEKYRPLMAKHYLKEKPVFR